MNYILIDEKELEIYKNIKKTVLKKFEVDKLIEYSDIFKKFLDKTKFSYQLELLKMTVRGNEHKIYTAIETIEEIIKTIDSIPDKIQEHEDKQNLQK